MKRCWIGFFILLALLLGSLGVTWTMSRIHSALEQELNQAADHALKEDWDSAAASSGRARKTWENWEHFRACFADHTPIEEIDADLEALKVYEAVRDKVAFAAASRSLARKIAAVGEAHELVWWNIF